jgi:hypothetical protein
LHCYYVYFIEINVKNIEKKYFIPHLGINFNPEKESQKLVQNGRTSLAQRVTVINLPST